MSEEENKEEQPKMTPEEYATKRAANLAHLKKEVEYLKTEKIYENLAADVEEARTRGILAVAQRAQFFAQQNVAQNPPPGKDGPPANQPAPEGPPANKPPRKLKKQE